MTNAWYVTKICCKIDSLRFHFWRCNIRLCSLYFTHLACITLYLSCTCIFTRYFHFYCSTNWTIWWKLRYRKIKHCYFRNNFTLLCFFVLHRLCKRKIAPLLIFTTFYYYWNIFFFLLSKSGTKALKSLQSFKVFYFISCFYTSWKKIALINFKTKHGVRLPNTILTQTVLLLFWSKNRKVLCACTMV